MVQILSRNGKISRQRTGKTGFDRRESFGNRIRSWIKQTTEGDEHVLMIRDTNRSLDEGIYSCQVSKFQLLIYTKQNQFILAIIYALKSGPNDIFYFRST